MTNKEAIEQLKLNNPFMGGKDKELFSQAIDKGIEALEKQKTGHWTEYNESVERFDFTFGNWAEDILHRNCSECGKEVMVEETEVFNYCPFCGAKMEGDK